MVYHEINAVYHEVNTVYHEANTVYKNFYMVEHNVKPVYQKVKPVCIGLLQVLAGGTCLFFLICVNLCNLWAAFSMINLQCSIINEEKRQKEHPFSFLRFV